MSGAVMVKDFSFKYAEKQVLNNITFEIQKGEVFGLLGPSGAGKTTLIKLLTGQLRQGDGHARLLGTDTRELSALERGQIGIMMDHFGLYERLSAYDNLLFYADIYQVPRNRIADVLKQVGLYEAKGTAVSKLSKGMKNRLSLARTLLNNAKVLFLDEPTSGLDPGVMQEIHNLIERQREKGTTIFLTTHNMEEAEKLCDRIGLLCKGKIVECGKPKAVCAKYDHQRRIGVVLESGEKMQLSNGPEAAEKMKELLLTEKIAEMHTTEPNLETVFLELTGTILNR